jgi:ubiquinone/menaquinone biosynthesis C-methylase UbiE
LETELIADFERLPEQNNGASANRTICDLRVMYSAAGLPRSPLFPGGLINFGFWPRYDLTAIDEATRIEASLALYEAVFTHANSSSARLILDVGCGQAVGTAYLSDRHGHSLIGIDIVAAQIKAGLARIRGRATDLRLLVAAADEIPVRSGCIDKVISVEAAQHFPSLSAFCAEAYRVLVPSGTLSVGAMFATNIDGAHRARDWLPTVSAGIDRLSPLTDLQDAVVGAGFDEARISSIGSWVFPAFTQWIRERLGEGAWGKNWLFCYENGWIDYYLVSCSKAPRSAPTACGSG